MMFFGCFSIVQKMLLSFEIAGYTPTVRWSKVYALTAGCVPQLPRFYYRHVRKLSVTEVKLQHSSLNHQNHLVNHNLAFIW